MHKMKQFKVFVVHISTYHINNFNQIGINTLENGHIATLLIYEQEM